ncbi:MAG: hypothetical protein HYV93_14370 [Candidatus Rokubacteria bacterium]|nr:hypothetical protein [Candidatus Rokubacteria bacterium]
MRTLPGMSQAALLVFLVLVVVAPVGATVVVIETAAALEDLSEQSLDSAITRAVEASIGRAAAMGLSTIWLDQAVLLTDRVVVRMVATDEGADDDEAAGTAGAVPGVVVPEPGWLERAPQTPQKL